MCLFPIDICCDTKTAHPLVLPSDHCHTPYAVMQSSTHLNGHAVLSYIQSDISLDVKLLLYYFL